MKYPHGDMYYVVRPDERGKPEFLAVAPKPGHAMRRARRNMTVSCGVWGTSLAAGPEYAEMREKVLKRQRERALAALFCGRIEDIQQQFPQATGVGLDAWEFYNKYHDQRRQKLLRQLLRELGNQGRRPVK
jgi:hypothetical protein